MGMSNLLATNLNECNDEMNFEGRAQTETIMKSHCYAGMRIFPCLLE